MRIYAGDSISYRMLPALVRRFHEQHPQVYVDISAEPQSELHIEEYDISLFIGLEGFNADVIAREIMTSALHLYAAPSYLKRMPPLRKVEDLSGHQLLKLHLPNGTSHWLLTPDVPHNKGRPQRITQRGAITSNHLDTLWRMTLEGMGIMSMSAQLARPYLARGELQRVLPTWRSGQFSIYAALPSRKYVPAHVRAFIQSLEQFRERLMT